MIKKWGIHEKVHLVVRDNASNNRVAFPTYQPAKNENNLMEMEDDEGEIS